MGVDYNQNEGYLLRCSDIVDVSEERLGSLVEEALARATSEAQAKAVAKGKPFKGLTARRREIVREEIERGIVEEEVSKLLKEIGFKHGWDFIRFEQGETEYEDYSFELDTDYVIFDEDALFVIKKDGRKTVSEPTEVYDKLLAKLNIEEVEKFTWIDVIP